MNSLLLLSYSDSFEEVYTVLCVDRDNCYVWKHLILAHLRTTCSGGAFRVVLCPSCVVNNFFKHFLLPNRRAVLDQTWQEFSLGDPLKNCSQKLVP